MKSTRLGRRKILLIGVGIATLLVARYLFFWGFEVYEDRYAKTIELTVPQGYKGSIAFGVCSTVRSDRDSGLFRLKLDGDVKEKISPRRFAAVRFDPAGKSLACIETAVVQWAKYPYRRELSKLFVLDQEGKETLIATSGGTPVWSPDGTWIVCTDVDAPYVGEGERDFSKARWTTWKYSKDGSSKSLLPLPEKHSVCDWSPDGRWFLTSKNSDPAEYFLVDAIDHSKSVALKHDQRILMARFSPDGSKLDFAFANKNGTPVIGRRDLISDDRAATLGPRTTIIDSNREGHNIQDFACSASGEFMAVATYVASKSIANGRRPNANAHLRLVKLADGSSEELKVTNAAQINSVDLR